MNESLIPLGRLTPHNHGFVVICNSCLRTDEINDPAMCRIYYENIGPLYSQHCFRCSREIVHGTSSTELFNGK